jgi:hypothetical protein
VKFRSELTDDDAVANPDFRTFGEEEAAVILDWVQWIGNRWKRIAAILTPCLGRLNLLPRQEQKPPFLWKTRERRNTVQR